MSGRVIVVGSVNIDLVARVPHLPHPGETVTGGSYERHHGGKGGNQAVAAARLRRPTLFIGAVGDDTFEKEARRALSSERVDVSMVASLPGQPTGVALILVDATGENQIAVVPGANGAIEPGYVRDCLARLGPLVGDVMLVCNEVPLHVVREALMCGAAAGATTVLNPAPAIGIDRAIFGLADIVTPNRNELATLLQTEATRTGRRLDTSTDAAVRARALLEAGPEGPGVRKAVIVTLGSAGVVVLERVGSGLSAKDEQLDCASGPDAVVAASAVDATGGGPAVPTGATAAAAAPAPAPRATFRTAASRRSDLRVWEVSAEKVATVDSTGAGDAFCGALAAALAEGRPLFEAVQRAVAGGALATTHVGAREGMPTRAELEAFLAARQPA
jgi:ribokinase